MINNRKSYNSCKLFTSVLSEHGENFERLRLNKVSGRNLSRSTLVFVLLYLPRVMLPSKTQIEFNVTMENYEKGASLLGMRVQ